MFYKFNKNANNTMGLMWKSDSITEITTNNLTQLNFCNTNLR